MDDRPQRPPRPDEEELLRFHNGDTLENIPVIRLPEEQGPQPARRWPRGWGVGAVVVAAAGVGALAAVGAVMLLQRGAGGQPAAATSPAAAAAEHTASVSPTSTPSPTPTPSLSTSAPRQTAKADPSPPGQAPSATSAKLLQHVRIIQAPATGGDPSTTYCLVHTGSETDNQKEAILLANTPAYQCTDLLSYDQVKGSLYDAEQPCQRPARPAVLAFDPSSSWGAVSYFVCLTQNHGA